MIYGNIHNLDEYNFLSAQIKQCFDYAKNHELRCNETGKYLIDEETLFVNIVEYKTQKVEERFWEAHKEYLDLHLMLEGEEQIDLNFIDNMKQLDFQPEKDFLPLEGDPNSHVILRSGDFLICYPNDGHRTAVMVEQSRDIKKAIFKIKIEQK